MVPSKMKAVICKEACHPLVVEEVPVPRPQGRELLVRVKAASLCHSDVTLVSGVLGSGFFPQIIGHEAVSVVEELGPDAASFGIKVGAVVGAPLWHDMCLECYPCKDSGPQFCPTMKIKGITAPGYFSEYTLVDAASAVVIPAGLDVPSSNLGPLFCAGITVWDALSRAKVLTGESVAIVGVGGLGELAAKYAHALGAKVYALDIHDEQLTVVKANKSVDEIINTRLIGPQDIAGHIAGLNGGRGLDVAIVTTGAPAAYQTALTALRPEGRLISVGIPHDAIPLSIAQVTGQAIQIVGAKVPGREGAAKCIDFSLQNGIMPKIHPRKFQLEDINEMIALMEAGQVQDGRMVVEFF